MAKGATSKSKAKDEENRKREEEQRRQENQKRVESKPQRSQTAETKPTTQEAAPKPTSTEIPTLDPAYTSFEPENASPEQIEEARDIGRRSLEMARAGQLDMSEKIPFTQGVRGYAEQYDIPKLEEAPSTTMPSDNYAPDANTIREQNASRNAQRRAENVGGPVDILGSRRAFGEGNGLDKRSTKIRQESSFDSSLLSDRELSRLEEIDRDIARISERSAHNMGSREDQRRLSGLQAERNKITGQNLLSEDKNTDDVVGTWLDPDYKMGRAEIEQARQLIDDYDRNEYKNSNIYDLTDEESQKLSQINALRDKVSKAEATVYGSMNATPGVDALLKAGDNDYYGWTLDDLRDEVARQRDIPMSGEVRDAVNQLRSEIDSLQNTVNDANTVYSTGDVAVDETIGANTSLSRADALKEIERKQAQMYKLMLESARGEEGPNYDSYSLRKANAQKQNPVQYTTGDMATRVAETMALQGAMGSNGLLADLTTDALTDTIPELQSNLAGGMSEKDAYNRAFVSGLVNTGLDLGAWGMSNLDELIPSLRNANEVADAVKQNELNPADLARQNEIDVNAKVDNVNQAVDEINRLNEQIPEAPAQPIEQAAETTINEINLTPSSGEMGPVPTAQDVSGLSNTNINQISDSVNPIEQNYRWSDPADRLIPEDSYARTDEFRQLEQQRSNLHREREILEDNIKSLYKDLEPETSIKPESEWNADDKILSVMGHTPESYTEKGQIIQERINEMRSRVKDLDSQISSLDDSLEYRRAQERLAQLENYQVSGITPATRNEYAGFSTESASSRYDKYVREGKAVLAEMSPEEYLRRCAYEIFGYRGDETLESVLSSRSQETINNLIDEIRNGTKLDAPYLDYRDRGQEGIHRALAAYELGIDKIPVVVRGTPDNVSDLGFEARKLIHDADHAKAMADIDAKLAELEIEDDADLLDFDEITPDLPEVPEQDLDAIAKVEAENANVPPVTEGDGSRQVSKYRTNSMNKLDSVNEQNAPMSDFEYDTYTVKQQTEDGIRRWGDNPNAVRELQAKENWDPADARYAQRRWTELMESGSEEDVKEAARLARKQSYELREGGRLIQVAAEMDDIAGQLNQAKQMMNQHVDKVYGVGTSEALDNMASKVEIALDKVDFSTKEGRDEAFKVMSEMVRRDLRSYAPTNKSMTSKSFRGGDKILRDIKSGKIDSVESLVTQIYKQNGGVAISAANQKKIYDLLELAGTFEEGSRKQEQALARAARIVLKGAPSGFGEKVKSIIYTNMLGNFKTAVSRNAFGNLGFQALEQARSPIAALVDRATSVVTKKHSTQGWNLGKAKAYGQGFAKGIADQASDIAHGINTGRSGALGWAEALKNNKTTWNESSKTAVGRGLAKLANRAEFYVTSAMKLGDRPFFEANYAQRNIELHQLVEKYGKDNVAGLSGVPDELLDDTIDMISAVHAADSVFQKRGNMAKGLTDIRNGLGELSEGAVGVDLLSTSATPFTMTPGNILEKGIEYSPLGIIKNAVETAKEVKGGNFNQRRFVDELSRTITGIPVLYGAYKLAENGNVSGGYSDDPDERAAQQADGYIEYGLNIGDKTYDTSDIPVFGQFMQAAGAINEDGLSPESLGQAIEAITMGSAMQGIRKAFGGDLQYSTSGSMLDNLVNTVKSAGTQLIPSLARQTAQTMDEYKRDLGEYGTNQYYINNIKNSIPGLRETLPIKYDNEGNVVLQNQGRPIGNKILENYLLPMNVSEYSPSELTQEATRLSESTDNNAGFVPRAARKDLRDWAENTEGLDYSEELFYDYKKRLGDLNSNTAESIIHSDFYNSLDDDDKVSVLADIYSAMKQVAKNEITGIETDNKLANRYMESEDSVQGLLSRLEAKYNPYGIDTDKYEEMRDQGVDFTPWEGYKEAQEAYDIEDNVAYREAYANGGYEGLGQEVQYQSALDEYGLTDSKTNRAAWETALHASADPNAAMAKIAQQRTEALDLGFTKSDGTVNTAAYEKATSVLGDDEESLAQYSTLQSQIKDRGLTKQTEYVPYVMGQNYSDTQKGQYMMLLAGDSPDNISGKGAASAYDEYGYDGYYYYRVLQNAVRDYNGDNKVNKYDRIQKMYEDGYSQGTDYFDFFNSLSY